MSSYQSEFFNGPGGYHERVTEVTSDDGRTVVTQIVNAADGREMASY